MAQIRNRGSNVWYLQIFVGKDDEGKKEFIYETFYGTKPQAKLYANKLEIELKAKGIGPKSVSMTMSDLLNKWLDTIKKRIEKSTYEQYEHHVFKLIQLLGDLQLYSLDSSQIEKRLAQLENRDLSPRTIKNYYRSLGTALNWAMGKKLVSQDVMLGVKPPKVQHVCRKVLQVNELKIFIETAKEYKHYLPLRLLALTGARVGEVIGLSWKNVLLDESKIKITEAVNSRSRYLKDTKTENSKREITLDSETIHELRKHKIIMIKADKAKDDDYVFQSDDSEFLRYQVIYKAKEKVLKKAGLHHIRIHDLRHGVGSILLDKGVSITGVAEQLGQVPATTASIYGHALRHGSSIAAMLD